MTLNTVSQRTGAGCRERLAPRRPRQLPRNLKSSTGGGKRAGVERANAALQRGFGPALFARTAPVTATTTFPCCLIVDRLHVALHGLAVVYFEEPVAGQYTLLLSTLTRSKKFVVVLLRCSLH